MILSLSSLLASPLSSLWPLRHRSRRKKSETHTVVFLNGLLLSFTFFNHKSPSLSLSPSTTHSSPSYLFAFLQEIEQTVTTPAATQQQQQPQQDVVTWSRRRTTTTTTTNPNRKILQMPLHVYFLLATHPNLSPSHLPHAKRPTLHKIT